MKKTALFFTFAIIAFVNLCFAQSDTTFFNPNWIKCERPDAKFYRLVDKGSAYYTVMDVFMATNKPQMCAHCVSLKPEVKEGKCTYYHENGTKEAEGLYIDNKRTGRWIWWDMDNKDSSVADCSVSGTLNWVHQTEENKKGATNSHPTGSTSIFTFVQQMPEFPGGDKNLEKYLSSHIKYPPEARKKEIEGTVMVEFVINEDGSISNIKAIQPLEGGCTEIAVRAVHDMPRWKPGIQNGDKVKVLFHLPVTFKLK